MCKRYKPGAQTYDNQESAITSISSSFRPGGYLFELDEPEGATAVAAPEGRVLAAPLPPGLPQRRPWQLARAATQAQDVRGQNLSVV